jgi:hypothetical protein
MEHKFEETENKIFPECGIDYLNDDCPQSAGKVTFILTGWQQAFKN